MPLAELSSPRELKCSHSVGQRIEPLQERPDGAANSIHQSAQAANTTSSITHAPTVQPRYRTRLTVNRTRRARPLPATSS